MTFDPQYIDHVLSENFEDAKTLFLSPLLSINYAHLVMLAETAIVSAEDAHALREALDAISVTDVRATPYHDTCEDLFFHIERLIESHAWTDAALALIDLELPQWQVRRLAYDEGEWHCALSRQRELPDWLDQSIETRHADLALAILSAFVEAQRVSAPSSRTSVPAVPRHANSLYEPVCSDNFA